MKNINSLKDSIGANDKVNDIKLSLRSQMGKDTIWILVEGIDDCKIYPKFFDTEKTKVEYVCGGKPQLIKAIKELSKDSKQVIAIADADFDHLEKKYKIKNLFLTDKHDIEMTMLSFHNVLHNVLIEHHLGNFADIILQKSLNEITYLAYIRWYNSIDNLEINFSGLPFSNIATKNNNEIRLEPDTIITELNRRSSNKTKELKSCDIENFINKHQTDDLYNLCNGHDCTAIIALQIGTQTSQKVFCQNLRLSFRLEEFSQTELYKEVSVWQNSYNYSILKNISEGLSY